MHFLLNKNTQIIYESPSTPIKHGIDILKRDLNKKFLPTDNTENKIVLQIDSSMEPEQFEIVVSDTMTIYSNTDLGFIYGLLYISEYFLGIQPFWFWLDQVIEPVASIPVSYGTYTGDKPIIKYRGWFFNDEVLLMKWNINGDFLEPFRMAFETLLRCGGNMTIPGTDKNSRKYNKLASDMGLFITHHHAEPLGAEMFVRAYPDLQPNYSQYPDLFFKLWEDAVKEQKDFNVIWNLGFRGQGDCPFWSNDSSGEFDTPKKRGALISQLIEKQRQLIKKYVKNPIFCTNLYGEIMELYDEGHITLHDEIIKICADNGYGKMVTRRRDNHCVRISSLPKVVDTTKNPHYGIYYHVSFYDLQAANHITMLPNSINFVNSELTSVIEKQGTDYWIINCSNVKPHAYYLDAVRKKWYGKPISDATHSKEFVKTYYNNISSIAQCLEKYPSSTLSYGEYEDQHAGEQFYTENIRAISHFFIRNREEMVPKLYWLTGKIPVREQVAFIFNICKRGEQTLINYYKQCKETSDSLNGSTKERFDTTILLCASIHYYCLKGVLAFCEGYEQYINGDYLQSFTSLGFSGEYFDKANEIMRSSEKGVWKNFYENDCFADIKHTGYMVRKMMGVIRELGDNQRHDKWYRQLMYSKEDRHVMSLLVIDNHMTDEELFKVLKERTLS